MCCQRPTSMLGQNHKSQEIHLMHLLITCINYIITTHQIILDWFFSVSHASSTCCPKYQHKRKYAANKFENVCRRLTEQKEFNKSSCKQRRKEKTEMTRKWFFVQFAMPERESLKTPLTNILQQNKYSSDIMFYNALPRLWHPPNSTKL